MNLKDVLEKAGIAAGLADLAISAIADKVNRELEAKIVEVQEQLRRAEEDRDQAYARVRELHAEADVVRKETAKLREMVGEYRRKEAEARKGR
jgi:uncharacterized coiled-coil DUF342 family protein